MSDGVTPGALQGARALRRAGALREARAVLAARSARPAPADIVYAVYVGILFALICGTPLVRFVLLALGDARVQAVLTSEAAARWVGLLAAGFVVAALLGGRVRGPVVPSPFVAEALGSSALPRRLTMRRPFVRAVAVLVGCGASLAALVLTSMVLADSVRPDAVAVFALGFVAYLLIVAVVWLAGEVLARSTVRVAALLVAALLVPTWAVAEHVGPVPAVAPWDWLARLWPASSAAGAASWPAPALAALAVGALALVPLLLDRLSGPVLAAQSRQWERVGMLARSADLAGAVATFRALPTAGRRLRIPAPHWPPLAFLVRDVVGSLRTPGRAAVGACGLLAAGWLVAAGVAASDGLRWIPVVAGPLLAYLAAGVWCDGFRLAAEAAGRPALFGPPPARHALLHAAFPLLVTCALLGAGAAGHGALEGWSGAAGSAWAAALGAFLVTVRAADAAKGPLPVALLMPVPTPMGDASSLNVLMWQSDALLVTLAIASGLTWAFPTAGAAAAAWLALATVAALAWARRRLRVADRPTYGDKALES